MWSPFRKRLPTMSEFRASIENPAVPLTDASAFYGVFGGGEAAAGVNVNAETALGIPAVWCAVNFLSNTVAALPLNLFKRTDSGNEKADKDPLYSILHDVVNDDYLTSFKWRKYSMVNTLLRGRSYSFIELNKAGRVMNLWPLNPLKVTVRREKGRLKYDYADTASTKVTYEAFEIIDLPFMMAVDGVGSIDPVSKMKNSLGLSIALEAYASKFFQNGGVPPLALEGPAASTGAIKRAVSNVIEAIREASQEKRNVLYMPPQHKLTQVGYNPQNSQMVEARRLQIEEVSRLYGLPQIFLQSLTGATYCLPADALVSTDCGPRRIVDVKRGDKVWSRDNGAWVLSTVTNSLFSGVDEIVSIRTSNRALRLNAKHPVLARVAHEVPLKSGEIGGRNTGGKKVRVEWKTEYVRAGNLKLGDTIVTLKSLPDLGGRVAPNGRNVTTGFMALCGLILGDGNVFERYVSIARKQDAPYMDYYRSVIADELHAGGRQRLSGSAHPMANLVESEVADIRLALSRGEKSSALATAYGVSAGSIQKIACGQNWMPTTTSAVRPVKLQEADRQTRFSSVNAAEELLSLGFGGDAATKSVPEWVFGLSADLRLAFIAGYLDADGTVDKKGRMTFYSINKKMIEQFRHICMSLDLPVTNVGSFIPQTTLPNGVWFTGREMNRFTCSDPGANRRVPTATPCYVERFAIGAPFSAKNGRAYPRFGGRGFEEDGCSLSKITEIKIEPKEPVYDLSVERTHNFSADGVVVHNTNSEQQDLHLTKHTLIHWLELIEQELNAKLFTKRNKTNFVEFDQDGLLRGDFSTRMEGLAKGVQNSLLTPDEGRGLLNRPNKGGAADKLFIQGATVPIDNQLNLNLAPKPTDGVAPPPKVTGAKK